MAETCYVVLEVGCLECMIPTRVIGVYDDAQRAQLAFEEAGGRFAALDDEAISEAGSTMIAGEISGQYAVQLHRIDDNQPKE